MRISYLLMVIGVMAIWGFSFVAIEEGLRETPPLLLGALRFFFTTFPAIFFIKKPKTRWAIIMGYGLFMFAFMFSFMFFSMNAGVSPGLASLLIQLQVFFTLFFAVLFFNEPLSKWQIFGTLISFTGLAVVGFNVGGTLTLKGIILIILSALSWGIANAISKYAGKVNMLALNIWGSLFAWPILLMAALLFEGGPSILLNLKHSTFATGFSVFYMAYPATIFGFSVWSWLLSHNKAANIVPFALLVPVFGMLGSILVFKEALQSWKILAAALIMGGLCLNLLGSRLWRLYQQRLTAN